MRFVCAFCFLFIASLIILGTLDPCSAKIEPIDFEKVSILAPCLLELSESYFKSERALRGSLVVINLEPHPKSFLQRRMLEALNEDSKHSMGLMIKNPRLSHRNASRVTDKAKNYLLLMLNLNDLKLTLIQWKSLPTWNPLAQTVVVFMEPMKSIEQKDKQVKLVFELLLKEGVIFVNAIFQMASDPLKLEAETWFPYHDNCCASSVDHVFKIHECTVSDPDADEQEEKQIVELNQDRYPKVPNTLHGCPMIVSAFLWEPFVVGDSSVESGLEILMLQTITQQMGLVLNFTILDKKLQSGLITPDNKTGIYADLVQKKSDVLVGGLYENPISQILVSSSIPYYQDDITWCVAKAGLAPTWLNVFIIFKTSTWIGLLLTLLITAFFLFCFARYEGNYRENYVWSMLVTLTIATGQYGHYWPAKTANRIFLGALFFFGLHINTAYHSYLINVLTNPRYSEQVNTVEHAIGVGMIFEVGENTVEFFKKDDAVSQYLLAHHKICHNIDECFEEITKDRTKALAISRSHALNNPFGLDENEDFFCFPISDDVVIYSAVMMFRKFHHLLPTINEKIRVISESGLLSKWQKDSQRARKNAMSNDKDKGKGGHGGGVQMKLRLEHVEGAFLIVVIGLSVAFIVFMLELITPRLVSCGKHQKLVKRLEKFLCRA